MPADEVSEQKEAILAAIERMFVRMARGVDLPAGRQTGPLDFTERPDPKNYLAYTFSTGYDSGTGETTMPFTLDFSILYGTGTDGDILTG